MRRPLERAARERWHFGGPSGVWVLSGGLCVSVVGAGCGGFARGVRPFRPGSFFFFVYPIQNVNTHTRALRRGTQPQDTDTQDMRQANGERRRCHNERRDGSP